MSVKLVTTRDGRCFRILDSNATLVSTTSTTQPKQQKSKSVDFTHFLSIPIPSTYHALFSDLQSKYASLFPAKSLIPLPSLHITLLMLSLPTEEHIGSARRVLKESSQKVYDCVNTTKVWADMKNIGVMQGNASII